MGSSLVWRASRLALAILLALGLAACGEKEEQNNDEDGDGFEVDVDCNDLDPAINPDATEVCDGEDNDCDGTTDEDDAADAPTWYADADNDEFGDANNTTAACEQPEGYVTDTQEEELVNGAINGMLHQLDPYSEYIPARDVEAFQKQTSGSYEGIGTAIDIQDGYLTIISPFEDSPAYKAGVLPGD